VAGVLGQVTSKYIYNPNALNSFIVETKRMKARNGSLGSRTYVPITTHGARVEVMKVMEQRFLEAVCDLKSRCVDGPD
jgi:hypothetical protein